MGSKIKRTVRKRWTLKKTVKDLSLSCAPGGKRDPICNANSLSMGVGHCLKPK